MVQAPRGRQGPMPARLSALKADITTLRVDAVVNAANPGLLGGGGVDGAIHRAAGPQLLQACRQLGGCATGNAIITPGFALPAAFIIHTVGPVWRGGDHGEPRLLASCYRRCIELTAAHGLVSVAFPAISTGVYGFPPALAAPIAVETVRATAALHDSVERVVFCCYSDRDLSLYQSILEARKPLRSMA